LGTGLETGEGTGMGTGWGRWARGWGRGWGFHLPCLTVCTLAQKTFQSSSELWLQRSHPRRSKLAVTTNLSKSLLHVSASSRSPCPPRGAIALSLSFGRG
jgi:hypothetical protein